MHSSIRYAPALLARRRPIHLTFFVTRRCNAACPFCFYQAGEPVEGGAPELALAEIRRVAGSMGSLLWLLFSGGEVFLRDDLVEVSGAFHDANRVAFLTYPSNGLLTEVVAGRTEEILKRCPESVVVVKLSLDGVGADHDALRQVRGGFDKLMRTYERLAALASSHRRLELGINTLFCSQNQDRMDGIIDFVAGLDGVRSHTLTLIRPAPGTLGYQGVDPESYRRADLLLQRRWSSRRRRFHGFAGARLKSAQDALQRRLIHRTMLERRRVIPCRAGRLNLVLTETGDLYPCEGRWDRSFGNVRETGHDVGALLRSGPARRILEEIDEGSCSCTNECTFLTNILSNPFMYPGLLRGYARLLGGWPRVGEVAGPGRSQGQQVMRGQIADQPTR